MLAAAVEQPVGLSFIRQVLAERAVVEMVLALLALLVEAALLILAAVAVLDLQEDIATLTAVLAALAS